jgi:hypothetical protein
MPAGTRRKYPFQRQLRLCRIARFTNVAARSFLATLSSSADFRANWRSKDVVLYLLHRRQRLLAFNRGHFRLRRQPRELLLVQHTMWPEYSLELWTG